MNSDFHCHSKSLEEGIRDIKTPAMIMWGSLDRWVPVKYYYQWQKAIPHATCKLYQGAGHTPMEEQFEDTANDLSEFLLR